MIHVDLSKGFQPRVLTYLLALIPGLFIEISLVTASPALLQQPFKWAGLGAYIPPAIALFTAFVVGSAAMIGVGLLQWCVGYAYRLRKILWRKLLTRLSQPGRFSPKTGWLPSRPWFFRYSHRTLYPQGIWEVQRTLHRTIARLLKQRYGLNPPEIVDQADWGVWLSVFGAVPLQELRGHAFIAALHATGWCGLAAAHFAPALRCRPYIGFSAFLIGNGILYAWWVARFWNDPVASGVSRIRALLAEINGSDKTTALPARNGGGEGPKDRDSGR